MRKTYLPKEERRVEKKSLRSAPAIKGHRQLKDRCLRAKWTSFPYVLLCFFEVDKEPNKNGRRAGFGPRAAIWEGLPYILLPVYRYGAPLSIDTENEYHWTSSLGSRREAFLSQNIRICMCSFPKTARYSVIIWPSLWKQHWPLTIDAIENTDKKSPNWEMPEGLCMDLGWFELEAVCKQRVSSWCCNTEVILGIQVSVVTYYYT